jgi:hypothetical protein
MKSGSLNEIAVVWLPEEELGVVVVEDGPE